MPFNTFGRGPLIVPNNISANNRITTFRTGDANPSLSHDLIVEDVSFIENKTCFTAGYRIICNTLFLDNSIISNPGGNATGQSAGLGAYAGSLAGGGNGGDGGDGAAVYVVAENGVSSNAASLGGNGGAGQASIDNAGAGGGTAVWQNNAFSDYIGSYYQIQGLMSGFVFIRTGSAPTWTGTLYAINGGAGGGGGGGKGGIEGAYSGGGGGGGGGVIHIHCAGDVHLTNGSSIIANGGNGGNGATAGFDTGGGGGGGGGGCVLISCNSLTMDATSSISCLGGSPGATGTGSGTPGAGANGRIIILTPNGVFSTTGTMSGADYPYLPVL